MPALALWTPEDGLLGALAPLGLALAAGTALVVDLDPLGPHYPGTTSLADLVAEGPRQADLKPAHRGVAVLRNGGVAPAAAAEVVAAPTAEALRPHCRPRRQPARAIKTPKTAE